MGLWLGHPPITKGAKLANLGVFGHSLGRTPQVQIWKELFQYVQRQTGATQVIDECFTNEKLDGLWDWPRDLLLDEICGSGPAGFCRP
jgi:hypothetical protein